MLTDKESALQNLYKAFFKFKVPFIKETLINRGSYSDLERTGRIGIFEVRLTEYFVSGPVPYGFAPLHNADLVSEGFREEVQNTTWLGPEYEIDR